MPVRRLILTLWLVAGCWAVAALPATAQSAPPGCSAVESTFAGQTSWDIYCEVPGTEEPSNSSVTVSSLADVEYAYKIGHMTVEGEQCWRVVAVAVGADEDHNLFPTPERLVNDAEMLYADKQQYIRCPNDPYLDGPTPEQQAMQQWEHVAAGLTPTVTTQPVESSVVGLPTFVMVEPYNPAADVDADAATVTWDFGAFQLRALSSHMVEWDDGDSDNEFAYSPAWQETNGRGYIEGDEYGPTGWSDGQPRWQGDQPLAFIYQESGTRGVVVNVKWEGEWRLPGGAWQDLAAPDLFGVTNVDIVVDEYQAVLTD